MKMILGLLLIGTAKLHASDDLLFLNAIGQVESGGRNEAHNPICGARGYLQITKGTWHQHSDWPHELAHNGLKCQIVGLRHIQWLKKTTQTTDYEHLAAMWKFGATGWRDAKSNERLDYTSRVMAIFNELKNK